MYKCKECGTEYDIKPDYCDCGNDEFDFVAEKQEPKQVSAAETFSKQPEEKAPEIIKVQPTPSIKTIKAPPPRAKKNFDEQYPGLSRFIHSLEPVSVTIFSICIVLSLYVLFFAWNPEEQSVNTEDKPSTVVSKNIPSIDKFWNSTPPVAKQKDVKPVEQAKTEQKPTIQLPVLPVVKKDSTQVKKAEKPAAVQKKVTTVPLTKTTKSKSSTTTANNQAQTNKATQDAAIKKAQDEQAKKAAAEAAAKKAAEEAQAKKLAEEQVKKLAQERAKQTAAAEKQELTAYKAALRNTIGRKIDFTKVIGDGSCTVAFKIDSSGKLVSRSFAKQSTNNTLNDAVYAAVMATPSYNPPPSGYKNETLNLNIRFYNGNFEISLP